MESRVSRLFSPCTVTLCSLPSSLSWQLSHPDHPETPDPQPRGTHWMRADLAPDQDRKCTSIIRQDAPLSVLSAPLLRPPWLLLRSLEALRGPSRFVVLRGSSRSSKVGRGHGCTEEQRERTEVRRQQRSQLVRQQPKAAIEAIGEEVGSPRCAPGPSKRKCRNKSDSGHGIGGSRLSHGLGTAEQDRGRSASVRTVDVDQEAKLRLAVF